MRSLEKPEAGGLRRMVAKDLRRVEVWTPAGLFLGNRTGYDVDMVRIYRVVARTVRGLFFHEIRSRLDDDFDVEVFCDDRLNQEPPEVLQQLKDTIIHPLAGVQPVVIGDGVFMYRHLITPDNPDASAWALTFYQGKSFLALTGPKEPTVQEREGEAT